MKLLFVISTMGGGGAQKLLADIAPMINRENKCELLVLSKEEDQYSELLISNGVKCTFIPQNIRGILKKLQYIYSFVIQGNYDIVHVNLFPALYYCSVLKRTKMKNIPFIYTEHNTDNRRRHISLLKIVERWVYKPYDYVVSISTETREALLKWINPIQREKFIVIDNGIQISAFANADTISREKISFAISNKDILLCLIGSFTEQKNHAFIIDVLKKLPSEYKLLLLGEGPLEEQIKEKVKKLSLDDRCYFLGFRKDVASIIKTSDIVVIPSLWEGFGLVAVEAMACGKPVICSDVPGVAQVVGKVGMKIKLGDVEAFASAITSMTNVLKNDIRGENKEKYIAQAKKFDIQNMVNAYLEVYNKLITKYRDGDKF